MTLPLPSARTVALAAALSGGVAAAPLPDGTPFVPTPPQIGVVKAYPFTSPAANNHNPVASPVFERRATTSTGPSREVPATIA